MGVAVGNSTAVAIPTARKKPDEPSAVDRIIKRETMERLHHYSLHRDEIPARLAELESEWDIERALEILTPSFILLSLGLSKLHSKKWLAISASASVFLLQHAMRGWSAPVPILRTLGFRTPQEIAEEKYSLKILRGDFDEIR